MTTDNAAEAIICAVLLEVQAELEGGDLGELERAAKELRRLHALNHELLEALRSVWLWMEDQADGQSKGGHATFDLMLLREQRDIARSVIVKATGE